MKQKKSFRRTTIISFGLAAFLVGLIAARRWGLSAEIVYILCLLPLLFIFRRRNIAVLVIVVGICLLAGVWRGSVVYDEVSKYNKFYGQKLTLTGNILDDPVYDDYGRLDFRVGGVEVGGERLPGQVRVRSFVNDLRRGDSVMVQGKLREGFGNYQAASSYGTVTITGRSDSPVEELRRNFFAAVYSVLPEPQGSLGLGFLVGLRSALPEDVDDSLRVAGLTHIVVASGYNLTVLVRLCRRLLSKISKFQSLAGSVGLIFLFLAVTGASPSMVRASVVTLLSLWAWYYGRKFHPILILLLGAALTAGLSPLYIWYDLGWWLSFLAFAGVLIVGPLITARFWSGYLPEVSSPGLKSPSFGQNQPESRQRNNGYASSPQSAFGSKLNNFNIEEKPQARTQKQPPLMAQVAIETSAAQLMATPLIMFTFGKLSIIALLANIAVVPFIPFAMAGTFIAGVSSLMLPGPIAAWFAVPAELILGYIVSVTQLFAGASWAQQQIGVTALIMTLLYAAVTVFGIILYRKSKYSFSQIPSIVE